MPQGLKAPARTLTIQAIDEQGNSKRQTLSAGRWRYAVDRCGLRRRLFQNPTLCGERADDGIARVSVARFAVHCFGQNASVNSPLRCSILDGERVRLWASLSARRNPPFTVARRACAITTAHLNNVRQNVFSFSSQPPASLRARYGVPRKRTALAKIRGSPWRSVD